MRYLFVVLLLVSCTGAKASLVAVKEHHIFDHVMTPYDIPYNECRTVLMPIIDERVKMHMAEPRIMCNTFGVVRVTGVEVHGMV